MGSYVQKLAEKKLIQPPKWLPNNILFEGLTGSVAYGVSNDTSDMDIVGFAMPPRETLFPHLVGEIPGFGTPAPRFEQFQEHHVKDHPKEYDITIYSLVKFFQLTMENNPNMVDALFLPRRCVLFSTPAYEHIRDNRLIFLHKGCWHKFRGYAYAQLHKIKSGTNKSNERRRETIEKFGYDTKFAYHIVRLILEVEQILVEQNLDLDKNSDFLQSIRRGDWTLTDVEDWFTSKEKALEEVYHTSTLPYKPDEAAIKNLLLETLESWYGDVPVVKDTSNLLNELELLVNKYKGA